MTPAEIVKSLRCCAEIGECEKCPIDAEATWDDCRKRDVEAADMIERLTAENAALRQPAADVAEVVHGKWVDKGIPDSILSGCSVCGFTCGSSSFFYCPNCGAKMDGGADHA